MRISRFCLAPFLVVLSSCVATSRTIPSEWLSVPRTPVIRSLILGADGTASPSSQPAPLTMAKQGIEIVTSPAGQVIANGGKALTEEFGAIESFDVSEARGEVVFSARRTGGFDIGLVAVEGSDISWVPADPADEVAVQWAPRGSKISYVIRSRFGDIVRTLHVPTAFSFGVDFALSRVHAIGWDPQAERYAVAYSSPVAAPAVDVLKYSGEQRTPAVRAAAKLDMEVQPLAGDAIIVQPVDIRYNERLPLVIWVDEDTLGWNDARAELLRTSRVALVVTSKRPDQALWERAKELAWVDASRAFIVGSGEAILPPFEPAGQTGSPVLHVAGDPSLPAGRYRAEGSVVSAPASVIESLAARFIADQVKRNAPPNGSR